MKRLGLLAAGAIYLISQAALGAAGDGQLGQLDPSDANEPTTLTGVWRSYSAFDPSIHPGNTIISTVIAYSSDNGLTFSKTLVLNPGFDLPSGPQTSVNEVSSLVNDPADANANAQWKDIWFHYLAMSGGTLNFKVAWLGMKTADLPNGTWSSETKLIAGYAYDRNNPLSPGSPLYPLPSALSDCMGLAEPGTLTASNGFYMSLTCVSSSGAFRVALVQFTHSGSENPVLTVRGTLLNSGTDVTKFKNTYGSQYPELKTTIGFSETNLVTSGGKTYLIATPGNSTTPVGLGCVVFEVTNLATAKILRTANGTPKLIKYVQGTPYTARGACTYATNDSASGIAMSHLDTTNPVPVSITGTGVQLP